MATKSPCYRRLQGAVRQDVETACQLRSRVAKRFNVEGHASDIRNAEGAYPLAKIHCKGERLHEVRSVPPRLFARCGLVGQRG
jgi:hypothetical protein